MPYKSKKQQAFMEGCKNNPGSMEGKCPPKTILDEFHRAEKTMPKGKPKKPTPKPKPKY